MSSRKVTKDPQQQDKHEAFKNQLVDDVLGQDAGDKVAMEKVVMLIWQFRDDPAVVTFMARFVAKYAGSRHVFDGIEFYLPQLAHMIIHLEVAWDDAILERFALVICQQSMHFALQFNWILQGTLQDYQPELEETGLPNPLYNALFYGRCQKLLKNVERCVVYGRPRAQELQRLYEAGKITKAEMTILEQADRRFNALQITADADEVPDDAAGGTSAATPVEGWLYLQAPHKKDADRPANEKIPSWQYRYCEMTKAVLNCYKTSGCCGLGGRLKLERAMGLERAVITESGDSDKEDYCIRVETQKYQFQLRCNSAEERTLWIRRMREEAETSALFQSHHKEKALKKDLTPAQLDRYEFFQKERDFVEQLTDLAEDLRFLERAERKKRAPIQMADLDIPARVYLPLCNSSDIWRRVSAPLPQETKVFNTKERCPVIMHFIAKRGEVDEKSGKSMDPNLDVAEYMHAHLDVVPEDKENGGSAPQETSPPQHQPQQGGDNDTERDQEMQEKMLEQELAHSNEDDGNEKDAEGDDDDDEGNSGSGIKSSEHSVRSARSAVWDEGSESKEARDKLAQVKLLRQTSARTAVAATHGNAKLQRFTRESVVKLPVNLANRLQGGSSAQTKAARVSVMDRQTEMQPAVPILEGSRSTATMPAAATPAADDASVDGAGTVVSVERSSMMVQDHLVLGGGEAGEGDIDKDSIARAKQYVSGGESWAEKTGRMLQIAKQKEEAVAEAEEQEQQQSQHRRVQLEICSCMSKSNDDLRQEVFVMQMIHYYKSVFATAKLPLWLKTYRILSTSASTGLIEVLTDATSLDGLKKSEDYPVQGGLRKYFEIVYGGPDSKSFKAAQANFRNSLAAYALVSYLLGLKDRHNGNIMIDTAGHLIFIDFGFAMGMAPGHEFSFERAPFKLTKEYVEVLDGVGSECYKEFERLFCAGLELARAQSQIALGLVEIMMYQSNYPCFSGWRYGNGVALANFEKRLLLHVPQEKIQDYGRALIRKAKQHPGTKLYDQFQKATNGYAM